MPADWITTLDQVAAATDEDLRRALLTCDGAGREIKEACLAAILDRAGRPSTPPAPDMRNLRVRATSIECIDHPEWGTWGVMEDRGSYYEIRGGSGCRVLDKEEAVTHWRVVAHNIAPAPKTGLTFPTLHLNGTSREVLQSGYFAAYAAVGDAMRKVEQIEFNGRDYYPQGPTALKQAQAEHADRLKRLADVAAEFLALWEHIEGTPGGR